MKSYTVGFMTYVHRYESHFLPLFENLSKQRPEIEKVVFFNGQHKEKFDVEFRKKCLEEMSKYDNTFVHVSPMFRSFSHMVNTNVNMSSNENILILSDDISVSDQFLSEYENILEGTDTSFLLNLSYAHFSLTRTDIKNVGYFDERLLGMGEEDGEWDFRFCETYSVPNQTHLGVPSFQTNHIHHNNEYGYDTNKNIRNHNGKHSTYNQNFLNSNIIIEQENFTDGHYTRVGPYGRPVQMSKERPNFYPGQIDFWENGDKL